MSSAFMQNLSQVLIDSSESDTWHGAVREWEFDDVEENVNADSSCVCGKENIRYLFTIKNNINQNTLFPIGSSCIKKFGRDDLNELTSVKEQLFKLLHAVERKTFITLDSEFFSRKIILYLYENDAFIPTKHNKFDGKNDYDFMVKMFNMRSEPTDKQKSKIKGLIRFSIIPYLKTELKMKA